MLDNGDVYQLLCKWSESYYSVKYIYIINVNDTYSYFMKEFLISKFKIALVKSVISLYMKFPLTVHLLRIEKYAIKHGAHGLTFIYMTF